MKKCKICGLKKEFICFGRKLDTKDGFRAECKTCAVEQNRARRKTKEGYEKLREYRTSERGKNVSKKATSKWQKSLKGKKWKKEERDRDKFKISAREKVAYAIKIGVLDKKDCENCGSNIKIQAHHDDYSYPLVVKWLCIKCHHAHHKAEASQNEN